MLALIVKLTKSMHMDNDVKKFNSIPGEHWRISRYGRNVTAIELFQGFFNSRIR